jgi:hypothetical protein
MRAVIDGTLDRMAGGSECVRCGRLVFNSVRNRRVLIPPHFRSIVQLSDRCYNGDIRFRKEVSEGLAHDVRQGAHARKVMESYQIWFGEGPSCHFCVC